MPNDSNFAGRTGYDPGFLGSEVALPVFSPAVAADLLDLTGVPGSATPWLHYEHFSLAMSTSRRFARVTAVTINGPLRPTSKVGRPSGWWRDDRLPDDRQVDDRDEGGNAELYGRKYGLDRGHLVRREDPVWGHTLEEAERANRDTHHFTNCTPQHESFNQDETTWRAVEEHIAEQVGDVHDRVVVFTGPVLADSDPLYDDVQVPVDFWKVIVVADPDGNVTAVAFRFSQQHLLRRTVIEAERVNWFERIKNRQVRVTEIEDVCGIDWGDLRSHDPLARRSLLDERQSISIPLKALSDIVV